MLTSVLGWENDSFINTWETTLFQFPINICFWFWMTNHLITNWKLSIAQFLSSLKWFLMRREIFSYLIYHIKSVFFQRLIGLFLRVLIQLIKPINETMRLIYRQERSLVALNKIINSIPNVGIQFQEKI